MDQNTALVIIDMQKFFYHRGLNSWYIEKEFIKQSWIDAIKHINEQIRQAKKLKIPILVVEYDSAASDDEDDWKTDGRIRRVIGKYPHVKYVKKSRDDGSGEIKETLDNSEWVVNKFCICGVNRMACVAETTKGLSKKYENAEIHLVEKAITDEGGMRGWAGADKLPNVIMV